MEKIKIKDEFIKLDQLLKFAAVAGTGGESKYFIKSEMVKVNGEVVTERGRKIRKGDIVELEEEDIKLIIE